MNFFRTFFLFSDTNHWKRANFFGTRYLTNLAGIVNIWDEAILPFKLKLKKKKIIFTLAKNGWNTVCPNPSWSTIPNFYLVKALFDIWSFKWVTKIGAKSYQEVKVRSWLVRVSGTRRSKISGSGNLWTTFQHKSM